MVTGVSSEHVLIGLHRGKKTNGNDYAGTKIRRSEEPGCPWETKRSWRSIPRIAQQKQTAVGGGGSGRRQPIELADHTPAGEDGGRRGGQPAGLPEKPSP